MKMKEILKLTQDELRAKLISVSQQYLELRMKKQLGQLKNPAEIRELHKDIARINLILVQKGTHS